MADLHPERWEAFSTDERAVIASALSTLMARQHDGITGREADFRLIHDTARLVSEISVSIGERPVDEALLARLEELFR